jgi:hypothetical protein
MQVSRATAAVKSYFSARFVQFDEAMKSGMFRSRDLDEGTRKMALAMKLNPADHRWLVE